MQDKKKNGNTQVLHSSNYGKQTDIKNIFQ